MPEPMDPSATPAPPVPLSGSARVAGDGNEVSITWQTRGDVAEATFEVVPEPDHVDKQLASAIGFALQQVSRGLLEHGVTLHLATDHPADSLDELAEEVSEAAGLESPRELLVLRRKLPVGADEPGREGVEPVDVRPFRPGVDDEAWIRANNAAFAGHPDQGRETPETLATRMAEPWFDPADFLVLDDPGRPGELAGFCWTKVHGSRGPKVGEIYVIGVDPSHQGEGLGPALVLAGLDHLAGLGIGTGMLYVDASNGSARQLYDRLGFKVRRRRIVYEP